MRRRHRIIGIALIVVCAFSVAAFALWKARVNYILRTVPLSITLTQILLHDSALLPTWNDVRGNVEVTVFEGLPHQLYEPEALKTEEKRKSTTRIGGFPFYSEPMSFKADDANRVLSLVTARASFETPIGAKACGGFHPDYALRLSVQDNRYFVLICLGCGDIRIILPEGEKEFALKSRINENLSTILQGYRKNRPPFNPEALQQQ